MNIKELLNVSEAEIEAEIAAIHAEAGPLREKREQVNAAREKLRLEAHALSRQIGEHEAPLRQLEVLLKAAKKRAGKTVIGMPVT